MVGALGRRRMLKKGIKGFFFLLWIFLLCEFAIYPIVIYQCSWPKEGKGNDGEGVKAMILADTHLLGPYRGHWFDKLRREWQMHRAFQTAVWMFNPEVVFFLGDLFDEGEWVEGSGFDTYVARFEELFHVPDHVKVHVLPGNHDTGFHYQTSRTLVSRFQRAFNSSSVTLLRIKDVNFVLLNSMAMEMDGCFLCHDALLKLKEVEGHLKCQKEPSGALCAKQHEGMPLYTAPILLQHFPLYRESDAICVGVDSAPDEEKATKFRSTIDCLSKESSEVLLHSTSPRLIMSGHTHHYCLRNHSVKGVGIVPEYSVPSFSWRNRNDPSFYLGYFTWKSFHLSKCLMPEETTVYAIYAISGSLLVMYLLLLPMIRCLLGFVLSRTFTLSKNQ